MRKTRRTPDKMLLLPTAIRVLELVFDGENVATTETILGGEEEFFLPAVKIEGGPGALDVLQESEQDLFEPPFDLRRPAGNVGAHHESSKDTLDST